MTKPENYIVSYLNDTGKTIIISEMKDDVLKNTYDSLRRMCLIYKHMLEKGTKVTYGTRPNVVTKFIKSDEGQLKEIIKEYNSIRDSLKYEISTRKLLAKQP